MDTNLNNYPRDVRVRKDVVLKKMDEKKMNPKQVAKASNGAFILRTIQNVISPDYHKLTKIKTVIALSAVFGCSIDELIDVTDTSKSTLADIAAVSYHSPGRIRLASTNRKLMAFFEEITEKLTKSEPDHILLYMFPGLIEKFGDLIKFNGTSQNFRIIMPSSYYPAVLEGIASAARGHSIEAIAEPSDPIERPMWNNADPKKTLIGRRLFLIPPEILMNPTAFEPVLQMLHLQRENYPVHIGVARTSEIFEHPFHGDVSPVGRNLILLGFVGKVAFPLP